MIRSKNYYHAVAVMFGYIVGVGMFSLPYLFHKSGILSFFIFLLVLVPLQYIIHLIYANLIIVTKNFHRLPGYTEIYLGKQGKGVVFFAKIFGNFGALVAYTIATGVFLHELLNPVFGGTPVIYGSLIFAIEALVIFFGISMIAQFELFMTILLLVVVILIAFRGFDMMTVTNYSLLNWKYFLLPYGAMLMSFDGCGALPVVSRLLNKDKKAIKSVIQTSMFLTIVVTIVFTIVILGVTGDLVTADALKGLNYVMNGGIVKLALIFGIVSMATSFLGVAESIKETLWWDFKINKNVSWATAVFVPYGFYLLGSDNLVEVVSLCGAVGGGLCGIILMMIFLKLRKKEDGLPMFRFKMNNALVGVLIAVFASGIIYELYSLIFGREF